ncbi:MAG: hypothetical protein WBQ75_04580 [Acetobacteraceae bacterium]
MKIYARLQDGRVAETFVGAGAIGELFHPSLVWIDITASPQVRVSWMYDGEQFHSPALIVAPEAISLAQLQAELSNLTQRISAFARAG